MGIDVQLAYDAKDPEGLGRFWIAALDYIEQPPPEGFATWDDALDAMGVPPEERDLSYAIVDPDGHGPRLFFQKVPEPKTAKNRLHIDINAAAGRGTDARTAIHDHVARLEGLGAQRLAEFDEPGGYWIVMHDPEGNEFCVQ